MKNSDPNHPKAIFSRPGSSLPTSAFFEEFTSVLKQFALYNTQIVVFRDLNLHLENPSGSSTTNFRLILDQFGLTVPASTHLAGGWLDVVIICEDCFPKVDVRPPALSDHGIVVASLTFLHERPVYNLRQIRGWRHLDTEALASSLSAVPAFSDPRCLGEQSTDDLFDIYNRSITDIIHSLLPVRPGRLRSHPLSPWFYGECHFTASSSTS